LLKYVYPTLLLAQLSIFVKKEKDIFFVSYYSAFTAYILFILYYLKPFYLRGFLGYEDEDIVFNWHSFVFLFFLVVYIFKNITNFYIAKRYMFAFFALFLDLLIKYILYNNISDVFLIQSKIYYNSQLVFIPLIFVIIQLCIEFYYFYEKEKPKWIRYRRMKNHKIT